MKIEYLDALPGAGKTTWILKHMYRNSINKEYIIVYSAPTRMLLRQVQTDLLVKYGIEATLVLKERSDTCLIENKIDDALYEAQPGEVLLISHEALLRSKRAWHNSEDVELIVDEQMTLVRDIPYFQPQIELKLWNSLFKPVKSNTFSEIEIQKGKRKQVKELRRKLDEDAETRDTPSIKLLDWVLDERIEVFAQCKPSGKRFMKVASVSIVSTSMFNNVGRAIIVGAFLESTEMFHVLKRDGHVLVELREKGLSLRDVSFRFKKLHIYPLFARKRLISKTSRSLLVCPKEHQELILQRYYVNGKFLKDKLSKDSRAAQSSYRQLRDTSIAKGKPVPALNSWENYLIRGCNNTVIDYFLQVWQTHSLFGLKDRPTLLAANNDIRSELSMSLHPNDVCRLLTPKSHGLNSYTHYERIAYFATMLPNPSRGKFYKDVLKDYSAKEWTINALAQSVTRTAVRNADSDSVVNVLVPDFECAMELKKKFMGNPKIKKLDIFGDYVILENSLHREDYTGLTDDEKKKKRNSSYYERNKERIKAKRKEVAASKDSYYERNKEKIKEKRRQRYAQTEKT